MLQWGDYGPAKPRHLLTVGEGQDFGGGGYYEFKRNGGNKASDLTIQEEISQGRLDQSFLKSQEDRRVGAQLRRNSGRRHIKGKC